MPTWTIKRRPNFCTHTTGSVSKHETGILPEIKFTVQKLSKSDGKKLEKTSAINSNKKKNEKVAFYVDACTNRRRRVQILFNL